MLVPFSLPTVTVAIRSPPTPVGYPGHATRADLGCPRLGPDDAALRTRLRNPTPGSEGVMGRVQEADGGSGPPGPLRYQHRNHAPEHHRARWAAAVHIGLHGALQPS